MCVFVLSYSLLFDSFSIWPGVRSHYFFSIFQISVRWFFDRASMARLAQSLPRMSVCVPVFRFLLVRQLVYSISLPISSFSIWSGVRCHHSWCLCVRVCAVVLSSSRPDSYTPQVCTVITIDVWVRVGVFFTVLCARHSFKRGRLT